MPRTGKDNERTERISPRNRKLTKVESLHQQVESPDKSYNDLAKFLSEDPYPVLSIHKDGTVLYANKASEPFLMAKGAAVGLPAPSEWCHLAKNALSSGQVIREETSLNESVFAFRVVPIIENDYVNFYGTDITEQRIAHEEREITIKLLSLINSRNQTHDLMKLVTALLRDWSGCEAVGIRLQDGEDFPYFETKGFPDEFVQAESKLCSLNELGEPIRDRNGRVYLECMCGNIISGRFDPTKPFFTEHGSFWSNSTTELLAGSTNADRMAKTRNRCNAAGYESVALVPLRAGNETLGLLQFNSKQKNRFTPEKITLFEQLADNLAIGLAQRKAEESLRRSETRYRSLFGNMLNGFAYCRMLYEQGRPQDFIYLAVNESFERLTGLKNVVGRRVTEVIPGIKEAEPELFEIYGRVSLTEKPEQFEINFHPLNMWLSVSVYSPEKEHFIAIFENITERKKAEEALRESEKRLRFFVEHTPAAVAMFDTQMCYIIISKRWLNDYGLDDQNIIGRSHYEVFPEIPERWKEIHRRCLAGEIMHYDNDQFIRMDGKIDWVSWEIHPWQNFNGKVGGIIIFSEVITERKQAEKELKQSHDLLANLARLVPGVIYQYRLYPDGRSAFPYSSPGINDIYEVTPEEVREDATPVFGRLHPDDYNHVYELIQESARTLQTFYCEFRVILPRQGLRWRWSQAHPERMADGGTLWHGIISDITERKIAEQKIIEYQKRLKQLASQLTLIEEQERRRIAGELHDEVSQTLAMAKIKLDTLQNLPPSEMSAARIKEISDSVAKVIQETRELTFELSNPILYELGFEAAVAEWLDDNVREKHGIAAEFYDDGLPKPLGDDLKAMLFRNVRELLTNCIKHAEAGKIVVGLRRIDDSIQVIVEDNGIGFDPAQVWTKTDKKATYGLFSIRENMENTGGRFEIESKPGAGCKAVMTAPLKDQNNEKEV